MPTPTSSPPSAEEISGIAIAEAIETIAASMKALNKTRLTRKAIVALIHDHSKVAKRTIEIVLNNLDALEHTWLKPKEPKK